MSFETKKNVLSATARTRPEETREKFLINRASRRECEQHESFSAGPSTGAASSHSSSSLVTFVSAERQVFIFALNELGKLRTRGKLMPSDSTHKSMRDVDGVVVRGHGGLA
jgi:Cdc6-like AAA superfamily ATPase